jgi:uncharacterized RDD family membrane protein YckC
MEQSMQDSIRLNYAGFWRRFGALWLDFIILIPLLALSWWGNQHFRLFDLYYFIPRHMFWLFYEVYLVRRYGGTPGKRMLGISVRKTDGSPVGYREALLRYLPGALLGALVSIGLIYAELSFTDAAYASLSFSERLKQINALVPAWYEPSHIALQIWTFSELIVMLTNRKRRALHDFIAGTIVVLDAPDNVANAIDPSKPTQRGRSPQAHPPLRPR